MGLWSGWQKQGFASYIVLKKSDLKIGEWEKGKGKNEEKKRKMNDEKRRRRRPPRRRRKA